MKTGYLILIPIILFCSLASHAQKIDPAGFQKDFVLHVKKTSAIIKVDGDLSEPVWKTIPPAGNFWRKYPNDERKPARNTEVMVAFDNDLLYFAFTCYDSGNVLIQSLKRDIGHDSNDGIAVVLDPVNKHADGFWFALNALNAQSDDQLHIGNDITLSWDGKWYSNTKQYADRWTAEIAIPFKSLRYSKDIATWGINFVRIDQKTNEYSTFTHVPVNFKTSDLNYTGALIWDSVLPPQGKNVVFVPYITAGTNADKENNLSTKSSFNAGFDAKIGLSPSLNADLTVNPDFAQVDVDQQVTNLTRYSILFPEKRNFFLENADLFTFGNSKTILPFYSRTIGLNQAGETVPIIAGAKISGNLAKSTRIGLLDIQTAGKEGYHAENAAAVAINQRVLKRSVIKAYYLNRTQFVSDSIKNIDPFNKWGRNAGLEFNYSNVPGTWSGWSSFHQSFKPGITKNNQYINAGGTFKSKHLTVATELSSVGTNYYTDMGYIQRISNYDAERDTTIRVGFKQFDNAITYNSFPENGKISQFLVALENFIYFNPNNSLNERQTVLTSELVRRNTAGFFASILVDEVRTLFPTAITNGKPLPVGTYRYAQFSGGYYSDYRKPVSYSATLISGGFYNGSLTTVAASLFLRRQPHVNISLVTEYDHIKLPSPYGSSDFLLISPKIELNFNTKTSFTTYLQFNTQSNNYNINSRFQYRFKPLSDLFLVYTDNYFTTPGLKNKNRAIVLKINYWLNL
jgi:hypothetical protein